MKNGEYILEISHGIPTDLYPTNGVFQWDQAKALNSAGEQVIFATVDIRSIRRKRKWGIVSYKREGMQVYEINVPIGGIPKKLMAQMYSIALGMLYKKIEREQGSPRILHAHFGDTLGYAAAKLREEREDLTLIITEHSSSLQKEILPSDEFDLLKYAYEKADGIIAVSQFVAEKIYKDFNKSSKVIPNIVDTTLFYQRESKKNNLKCQIVSTGNLIHRKGFDILLQALASSKYLEKIELSIFGEGPERNKLEDLINQLHLDKYVKLVGLLSREELAQEYYNADFFALATRFETFGVVFIEAMACGLPVIGTKCKGAEDFITPEVGRLVDTDDIGQLTKAIDYMVENYSEFDTERIASYTRERFSPETVAKQLITAFKEYK